MIEGVVRENAVGKRRAVDGARDDKSGGGRGGGRRFR